MIANVHHQLSQVWGSIGVGNGVRVHSPAYPQQPKALKHFIELILLILDVLL
jgi:hypothetical protein